MPQGIRSTRLRFFHPLTHRSFGHAEGFGYTLLFPACLIQLPGMQAAIFAPVLGKEVFLAHTSFIG